MFSFRSPSDPEEAPQSGYHALSGLRLSVLYRPRASPWAALSRPFGAEKRGGWRALVLAAALMLSGHMARAEESGAATVDTGLPSAAAVTTLAPPPALQERPAPSYDGWKQTALGEVPAAPGEVPPEGGTLAPGTPPGTAPLQFTADQIDTLSDPNRVYLRGHVKVLYREY